MKASINRLTFSTLNIKQTARLMIHGRCARPEPAELNTKLHFANNRVKYTYSAYTCDTFYTKVFQMSTFKDQSNRMLSRAAYCQCPGTLASRRDTQHRRNHQASDFGARVRPYPNIAS